MHRYGHRGWLSNSITAQCGLTLIELLVTLLILSILAAAALPYAEVTVKRNEEIELRRRLRMIRTAIDRTHYDWKNGKIAKNADGISRHGYPKTLQVLVDGLPTGRPDGSKNRYLRRIPLDPFGDKTKPPAEQWRLRGYDDEADSASWSGTDVYDVRTASERIAIDGSHYKDW